MLITDYNSTKPIMIMMVSVILHAEESSDEDYQANQCDIDIEPDDQLCLILIVFLE